MKYIFLIIILLLQSANALEYQGKKIELADVILKYGASEYIEQKWSNKQLIIDDKKRNRHGNIVAHVKDEKGNWLQEELIKNNLVNIYPTYDSTLAEELLKIEKIKPLSHFKVKENSFYYKGKFLVVEALVYEVKEVKDKIFINTDVDWKTDFTILVSKKNAKKFDTLDLYALKGKKIKVRGWLEYYNGPLIKIYNQHHLQLL